MKSSLKTYLIHFSYYMHVSFRFSLAHRSVSFGACASAVRIRSIVTQVEAGLGLEVGPSLAF